MATDQLPELPIEPSGLLHRDDGYYTWTKGREPERKHGGTFYIPFFTEADVRAAIAADRARAVPVAWLVTGGRVFADRVVRDERAAKNGASQRNDGSTVVPLYTRPPAPEQPDSVAVCARCGGIVSDPVIPQPADLSGQAATAAGEREAFEAFFADSRRGKGKAALAKLLERMPGGDYAQDHTQRHWWTWQHARASLSTPASGEGWKPIKTAPKDGTNVLLVNRKGNIAAGLWIDSKFRSGWYLRGGNKPDVFFNDHHGPTHWRPLPPAPTSPTSPTEPAAEGGA